MTHFGSILLAVYEPLPQWLNFLAMFIALALGVFGVLIWAVAIRKKRPRRRRRHHSHRAHRKLNPTLAEIGELPEPRPPEKTSESPPA